MNKAFALLFSLICSLTAASQEQPDLYLTGYTIGKGNYTVGEITLTRGQIQSVDISGADAALFKIGKGNTLKMQSGTQEKKDTYDIELSVTSAAGIVRRKFKIVEDEFIVNKVIAHRGAWKNTHVPENSIAALAHAIGMGCQGSEFDVHMSSDSIPFVNHDAIFNGTSIAKARASELQSLKLDNGESLPTLEAYLLAGMKQNKTKLILEIKTSELGKESSIALTKKIIAIVERLSAQAWVDYISFDFDVCREVMRLAPYAKVAYLNGDKSPDELSADHFYGLDYHFSVYRKNPDWIRISKEKKLTVNVWTVNTKADLEEFLKLDVEFITTNEPELLLSLIK